MELRRVIHLYRNQLLNRMKNVITIAFLMVGLSSMAQQALGEIQGYLIDKETKEQVPYAPVFIQDISGTYQTVADIEGMFRISAIPAGTYTVKVKFEGDTINIHPVHVSPNTLTRLGDVALVVSGTTLKGVDITPGIVLIPGDLPVSKLNAKEISQSVSKNDPKGLITGISSEVRQTEDGELVFRGARKGDMLYIVDGIKANEVYNIPSSAINNMMVYTGALPAKYGDTMGGVVVIESKSYFDLYKAWLYGQ